MTSISEKLANCFPESGPIADTVRWAAELTHAPPELHLVSTLPLVGYEMARRGFTIARFGAPVMWFAVVAPAASAKSSAMRRVREMSRDVYKARYRHAPDIMPNPWIDLEGSMAGVLQRISQIRPEADRTSGILYHTEVSKVLRQDEAIEPLCKIYDAEPYTRNLRYLQKQQAEMGGFTGSQGATLAATTFGAVVSSTPAALKRVMRGDALSGGLFSRFMWLRASLNPEELMPFPGLGGPQRDAVIAGWGHWISTLEGFKARGDLKRTIVMSPEAERFYVEQLFETLRPYMVGARGGESSDYVAGVALRVTHHAVRIAAAYAFSRPDRIDPYRMQVVISEDDLRRASNLAMRAFTDACTIGQMVSFVSLDIDERASHLLSSLRTAGAAGLGRSDCYAAFGNRIQKRDLDAVLDTLTDSELAVAHQHVAPGKRSWWRVFAAEAWPQAFSHINEHGTPPAAA